MASYIVIDQSIIGDERSMELILNLSLGAQHFESRLVTQKLLAIFLAAPQPEKLLAGGK